MPMFPFFWKNLSLSEKFKSFFGTARRVFKKRLRHPVEIERLESRVTPGTKSEEKVGRQV